MELMVKKNDLLKELSLLQGIVERKNTIPILANVLLDAGKNHVALLATDLDVGLRTEDHAEAVAHQRLVVDDRDADGHDVPAIRSVAGAGPVLSVVVVATTGRTARTP